MIKGVKHMRPDDSKFATVPVGKLGIIVHPSCAELGKRIDQYIVNWRKEREPVSEPVKQRHSSPILFVA